MEKQVFLYNQSFFFTQRVKQRLKNFVIGPRGPEAVFESLTKGLRDNGQPYLQNAKPQKIETAAVLNGVKTLRRVLLWKKQGLVKKIIAGPNISNAPNDNNGILRNQLIDLVIVASPWVGDFYASQAPELKNKIRVWAAGVTIPAETHDPKTYDFLVYNKTGNSKLFADICGYLELRGLKYITVAYGSFKQTEYFSLLAKSKFEIYLSESETQGLAIMEAWARNVPTLVWDRGFWQNGANRWEGNTASPYVTPEIGERFKNFEEFKNKIQVFMAGSYSPKSYAEKNFSNAVSAQKFLDIYNS